MGLLIEIRELGIRITEETTKEELKALSEKYEVVKKIVSTLNVNQDVKKEKSA
jgi:hypothetical protein